MSEQGEIFQYRKRGGKFLKMRKEFLILCEWDLVDALILRVFENELEQKRAFYEAQNSQRQIKGQQPMQKMNFWIEMSWPRLIHKLHMDGHMTENTIKAHVRAIIKRGHLEHRKNPKDPNRKPWQFMLNLVLMQKEIDKMGDEPMVDDASYEIQGSKFDPSTSDPSNFQGSNNRQSFDPQGSNFDPPLRSSRGQSLTPYIDNRDSNDIDSGDSNAVLSDDKNSDTPPSFSLQDMIAQLQASGYTISQEPSHPSPVSAASGVHLDNPLNAQPTDTKEHTNGTTHSTGDHRATGNDLAPLSPLSHPQGLVGDTHGATVAQQQSRASGVGAHTREDTHGQPTDTLISQVHASGYSTVASASVPSQSENDTPENLDRQKTLSDASTTERTSQTEVVDASLTSNQSPIASETPTPNDAQTEPTLSRSGENATAGDGGTTEQNTPPESGAKEQSAKPSKPRTPRVTTPKPTPPAIALSADEQAFYDLYCSMPWIKVAPEITAKVKEHCCKLAPHLKTQEQMYSLRRFMNGKDFFKGKGFNLPLVVMALNDWAMTQEPIDLEERRNEKPVSAKDYVAAMNAASSYQPLQLAPRPERKAQ